MIKHTITAACALALVIGPTVALADVFNVTYSDPGVQTPPTSVTTHYETFTSGPYGTTTFGGTSIIGTYSGDYLINSASAFGGAGGTGSFIQTALNGTDSEVFTVTLSQSVNYFGLWFSSLDPGNQLTFYNGATEVYSFDPADYHALVGACPSGTNPYCGNPNPAFLGQDAGQLFAYLNFLDTTGTFDRIVFTDILPGQFESDNWAVAQDVASIPGTALTPEPSSLLLLSSAAMGMAGLLRRRLR